MSICLASAVATRRARPEDLTAVAGLVTTAYAGYEREMGEQLWRAYSADLVPRAGSIERTVVVEVGGVVVATARYQPPSLANAPFPPGTAMIRAVAVDRKHEGRGLARLVMQSLHDRAVADGAGAVGLHTVSFMHRAVQLYPRLGYRRAPEYDVRADEHFRLASRSQVVAEAYLLPLVGEMS